VESLTEKLLALVSFSSKKAFFLTAAIIVAAVALVPLAFSFFFENARIQQQVALIAKVGGIERSSLKDPQLREQYSAMLNSLEERRGGLVRIGKTPIPPKRLAGLFSPARIGAFISGAFLWTLLAIVAALSNHRPIRTKIIAAIVLVLLAFVSGVLAERIPPIEPRILYLLAAPAVELFILSAAGTMLREINRG
jgi:steroid 5-alpha reductase family enzyme